MRVIKAAREGPMTLAEIRVFKTQSSGIDPPSAFVPLIAAFIGNKTDPIASVTEGEYTVTIIPLPPNLAKFGRQGLKVLQKKGVALPAPGGFWMGQWDQDIADICGVKTEAEYEAAPREQRAGWDATVQANKYTPHQFFSEYADFWYIDQWEHWWFQEGGARKRWDWSKENEYWRKRLGM